MAEIELTTPVDLCDDRGRLNPNARGWSRQPLHRANLSRSRGRKKRWDYWAVTSPDLYLSLTYADVDYLGIASVWICRPSTGLDLNIDRMVPLAHGFHLPEVPCTGHMAADRSGLRLAIDEQLDATRLTASCAVTAAGPVEVDLMVQRPLGHESLNVVIPWSPKRFQFTSKQNTRPARGTVRVGDTVVTFDDSTPAYGTLDLGRGVWPYSNRWNWAAASGVATDGRTVGLQFGGKWTEGTGYTENGVCVEGRLHKIGDELEWTYDWDDPLAPWRVRDVVGDRVDATLTPVHDRHSRTSLGVLSMEVHQCFGTWAGRVTAEDGSDVEFTDVVGFAEEARNRW